MEYFEQAGGKIDLEQDADDAVQLMTVHAAKGLEFDHVFLLRLTRGAWPITARTSVLEFPEALMQEELPAWDFHTQEERRLFYVALTRARERLTLTTVVHTRSKPSPFLDDILGAPQLAREHVEQSAPKSVPAPLVNNRSPEPLFTEQAKRPRVYSRIADWALEYRPPVFEPLQLSSSAIDTYKTCPQRYLFSQVWKLRVGPRAPMTFGNVMHTTIREFLGSLRKGRPLPPFEEVETIFQREWSSAGFEDTYQEECYRKDGLEQLRVFHASCVEVPPDILAQEKAFALDLENNVQVTGRIDQVNRLGSAADSDGETKSSSGIGSASAEVEIIEYKTGRPKTDEKARKDLQLGIYALAAREALDLNAMLMVYHSLENNQRACAGRDAKQLADVRNTIQEVAADIRARIFPPDPGFSCRSCDYRTLCPAIEAGRVLPEEEPPEPKHVVKAGKGAKKPQAATRKP
jgi:DNA helicase-2/ATP-dependent DNA helicase PcrA